MTADRDSELLHHAVAYARLAPSVHNTQPWLFVIEDGSVTLRVDPHRRLDVLDPTGRQQVISCGAAVTNLELALRAAGRFPEIDLAGDDAGPDYLARVRPTHDYPPSALDQMLFDAIPHRRTNRHALDGAPVSRHVIDGLRRMADTPDGGLVVIDDVATHAAVTALTTVADRTQSESPTMRAELRRWVRADDRHADGIPFSNRGLGAIGSRRLNPPVRDFDIDGRATRAVDPSAEQVDRPVLAALWTHLDRPRDWLRAGMAMQRVLLVLTSAGLSASFVNQPVDDAAIRPYVAEQLGIDGWVQVILRIGVGVPVAPAPRRSVEDLLVR